MHVLSPLYKGSRKVYYKSRKLPKNMSTAEYNALKTKYKFSESADLSTDDYNNTLEALAELEHDQ
jgi:hypothetical protein